MLSALTHKLCCLGLTVALALRTPHAALAASVALESDALAYPLGGYSAIIRVTHDDGFSYALGAGRYSLPTLLLKGKSNYGEAGWEATAESIQVLRVGYRFFGPRADGPAVDAIALNQVWHVQAPRLGGDTHFDTIGVGVSGGWVCRPEQLPPSLPALDRGHASGVPRERAGSARTGLTRCPPPVKKRCCGDCRWSRFSVVTGVVFRHSRTHGATACARSASSLCHSRFG